MVERSRGKVRIEVVPWLTQQFGKKGSSRLVLDEEIDGEQRLFDFLALLAKKYSGVRTGILDLETGQLFDHVTIVHNDEVLAPAGALEQPIKGGDSLVFLPAYVGGCN